MASKNHKLVASDFVHLHNHTQYSLLDGLTKVPALIDQVKADGMTAVAMTDHGTLSGAIELYTSAKSHGIKPIIGMEAYVASRQHTDKDVAHDKQYYHLIILAMNNQGYQNLMQLSTIANLEGFYYKPRIDRDLLKKYNEGLIVLSGCISSEFGDALRQDQIGHARQTAEWYKSVFGDRYYIEIQDHGHPKHPSKWNVQVEANKKAFEIAKELNIATVITGDAHYLRHEDQDAHEILLCVQTGSFLTDEKRMSLKDFELHVAHPQEIIDRWGSQYPEAVSNSGAIADRCSVELSLGNILIPKFPVPKGETEKSFLDKLTYRGLAWRYTDLTEESASKLTVEAAKKKLPAHVAERAAYELGVIEGMGFNGYFLIVADFINWGKDQGIVFGPGRGSAAGSIIAYAMKITELDPLKYDLLFERFLNPDRISMPDVDIDIQDTRRDEVIQYCIKKYGKDRVANIVTFGRMAARNAVRDVARVLQVPYAESDRLAKMIPQPVQGRHIPLEVSIKKDADLKREYETNQTARTVFDLAIRLEGTIRSHGVHAAGVVIAPDDIVKFTPLEMAQKGVVATQYSMGPIEDLGLLKMDFLGLSNLTIVKNTLRIVKKVYDVDIDINTLPLDDVKTYELLQRGDTTGVFQFESSGMKRYMRDLKPTVFGDIVAMGALYRPGPLSAGLTDSFIRRKNGNEKVSYDHPLMKAALKDTYGVLVYQEQFMQISRDVCGFTGGEADTLRKAIGKKKRDMMMKMEKRFIEGAVENGIDRQMIEGFWKKLIGFADYCFNKSHSACYGMISYWTAYLKAHYPAAFMAALMTSDYDDIDRLAIEISECKHMGIKVLPPDVQESFVEFAVVQGEDGTDQIRFGMNAIKNVGTGTVEEILRARAIDGEFKGLEDFLSKTSPRTVNRKALESLVKAGAFEKFGERTVLLNNLDTMLAYANRVQKDKASGQTDLFGGAVEDTGLVASLALDQGGPTHTSREQLLWERELLGIYLSRHPLSEYETFLSEQCVPIKDLDVSMDGKSVRLGGSVAEFREITTKNGQKMAFIKIADMSGEVELILFPNTYQQTLGIWERDNVIVLNGKISTKDREGNVGTEIKIMVDDAREVTTEQANAYQVSGKKPKIPKPSKVKVAAASQQQSDLPKVAEKRIYIRMPDTESQDKLMALKELIDTQIGTTPVVLVVGTEATKKIIKLPHTVEPNESLLAELAVVFGEPAVKYQ
ncbi:MAG: DNA polymerase III subunit alpha [Candidatus Saccharimonadales bacterium]